jgi:selenocysteine lyase/cysteine desulfurase
MLDYTLIAKEFSYLADRIYLDCSSLGVPPLRTRTILNAYFDAYILNEGKNLDDFFHNTYEEGKKQIGRLLKVNPASIAFFKSTSDAIINAANAIPFSKGDEVIITTEEHPANVIPYLALEKTAGIKVKFVNACNRVVTTKSIIEAITPKTKVVSVSSAFYCTGTTLDLKAIAQACRERGILFFVDAIQSVGRIEIEPSEIGIDFLACGGYKSLLGLKGIAIGYMSDTFIAAMTPYSGSNQSVANCGRPTKYRSYAELEFKKDPTALENGNPNYMGILSLASSVGLINELGIAEIEKHVVALEGQLRKGLKALPFREIENSEGGSSGIVVAFPDDCIDYAKFRTEILKSKLKIAVRDKAIRIGISFYNTPEQIEQALEILDQATRCSLLEG